MSIFDAERTRDRAVAWIRDYFREAGAGCPAVVGISGGKDSSVTAALCAAALGAERVVGVLAPQGRQWDLDVSRALVAFLGIRHCLVNIGNTADALFASLAEAGVEPSRQAKVNSPARIRMAVLYAVSAGTGGRVANTCNLSEDRVGYSTKFGDSAGDFGPLALLTATEVRALGRALGLPATFVDKTPEDGLSGLSDEENLGFTYAVLDRYIRDGVCEDAVVKEKIDRLQAANLHKLRPMPVFDPAGR
ncbi:MAG: NAD(+) synthase [Treponema sp.]|nr:NAD(+) synthase [Treponema sp.]